MPGYEKTGQDNNHPTGKSKILSILRMCLKINGRSTPISWQKANCYWISYSYLSASMGFLLDALMAT